MKSLCCAIIFVVLLCSHEATSVTSKDKENVAAGIKTIKTINRFIQSRNFNTFLSTLTQNTKLIINAASSLVKLKLSGVNGFTMLPARIYSNGYEEVKRMIDWSVVQISYGEYEASIKASARMLREILDAPNNAIDAHKKDFMMKFESDYRNAGLKLWEGLMYESSFRKNVLAAARKFTHDDRRKIQAFGVGVTQLLAEGIEVEVAYAEMKHNNDAHTNTIKTRWVQRSGALRNKLKAIDDEIVKAFTYRHHLDYRLLANKYPGMSNSNFGRLLLNHLSSKYYWRKFGVIIQAIDTRYRLVGAFCGGASNKRGNSYVIYGSRNESNGECDTDPGYMIQCSYSGAKGELEVKDMVKYFLKLRTAARNYYAVIHITCTNCDYYIAPVSYKSTSYSFKTTWPLKYGKRYLITLFGNEKS